MYCHLHRQCPNQNCQLQSCCNQLRGNLHTRSYTESHVFCKNKLWSTDFDCQIGSCSELWALICREQGTKTSNDKVRPLKIFHRTPWIENFCPVKPSLQVNADKLIQESF